MRAVDGPNIRLPDLPQDDPSANAESIGDLSLVHRDDLNRELRRHISNYEISVGFIRDPITRERLDLQQQFVNLAFVSGSNKDELIDKQEDFDKSKAHEVSVRRLNSIRAVAAAVMLKRRVKSASTSAERIVKNLMHILDPHAAAEKKKIMVLGAAASGKSCLLRRFTVHAATLWSGGDDAVVPLLIPLIELARLMSRKNLTDENDLLLEFIKTKYSPKRTDALLDRRMKHRLLLILDGLDEAGYHKPEVERWIGSLSDEMVVVSSRISGFNREVFSSFTFVRIKPLSAELQEKVVAQRLSNYSNELIHYVQHEIRKPTFLEMAANPLMLSLLISIMRRQFMSSHAEEGGGGGTQQVMTRCELYRLAVDLMLHKQSSIKHRMRRDANSVVLEEELALLSGPVCYEILERMAVATHSKKMRAINLDEMVPDVLDSLDDAGKEEEYQRCFSALNSNTKRGAVALLTCLA